MLQVVQMPMALSTAPFMVVVGAGVLTKRDPVVMDSIFNLHIYINKILPIILIKDNYGLYSHFDVDNPCSHCYLDPDVTDGPCKAFDSGVYCANQAGTKYCSTTLGSYSGACKQRQGKF